MTRGSEDNKKLKQAYDLLDQHKYEEAAALFEEEFDGKNAEIAVQLGYIYDQDTFPRRNLDKAKEFYLIAAQANNSYAQHAIGGILKSQGNIEGAIDWMRRASDLGNSDCSYLLFCHFEDAGQRILSEEFLKKAVEQGYAVATQILARRSMTGRFGLYQVIPGVKRYIANIPAVLKYAKSRSDRRQP